MHIINWSLRALLQSFKESVQMPNKTKFFSGAFFFIIVSLFFYWADQRWNSAGRAHWWSLLPPLLAIAGAFISGKVFLSLGLAVLLGGILTSGLLNGVPEALGLVWNSVFTRDGEGLLDFTNLRILGFITLILPSLGILVESGSLAFLLKRLTALATNRRSAMGTTYFLGLLVFIDDYANTMMVGPTMKPVCDRFKVSRAKLAFLVDSTSAPVAGLAVISTWIGYEVGLFGEVAKTLNLGMDGYGIFFQIIGMRFYCILMLVFIALQIWMDRDYGPMHREESAAIAAAQPVAATNSTPVTSASLFLHRLFWAGAGPIIVLFLSILVGLWADGGGLRLAQSSGLGHALSLSQLREILSNANSPKVLFFSGLVFFALTVLASTVLAGASIERCYKAFLGGLKTSLMPLGILILAWSLKKVCDTLHADQFLVDTFSNVVPVLVFPVFVFTLAAFIAFSTGTSWGTMSILIPTLVPMAYTLDGGQLGVLTLLAFAAILDGAIFGDHCSPISDTTIMSSTASECDHLLHVNTQIPYALTVAVIAGLCYVMTGLGVSAWLSLALGAVLCFVALRFLGRPLSVAGKSHS